MRLGDLFLAEDDGFDNVHKATLKKTGFWGKQGAGCLFLAKSTGRILIDHRSEEVEQPHTWGTWGGAVNPGETVQQAVKREIWEETGHEDAYLIIPLYVFKAPNGTFEYYNFLAIVEDEFIPVESWESQGYQWCEFGDWPSPLHFGLISVLNDPMSVKTIQGAIQKYAASPDQEIEEDYDDEDDFVERIDPHSIMTGFWIDTPHTRGFSDYPGIYITVPGSNTAYGNYKGGFKNETAAHSYVERFLGGNGHVVVRR